MLVVTKEFDIFLGKNLTIYINDYNIIIMDRIFMTMAEIYMPSKYRKKIHYKI